MERNEAKRLAESILLRILPEEKAFDQALMMDEKELAKRAKLIASFFQCLVDAFSALEDRR